MRRDARAALTIAKNRPKIGLSAGRSSTASFGGLDGGGGSRLRTRLRPLNSLPAGNLQGISPILAPARRFWPIFASRYQWLLAEIPYSKEQGIFERRAGNFIRIPGTC